MRRGIFGIGLLILAITACQEKSVQTGGNTADGISDKKASVKASRLYEAEKSANIALSAPSMPQTEGTPVKGQVMPDSMQVQETYDEIVENPFKTPQDAPMSTFSIDVDKAAYANVRRYINNGSLPPADAVRIEEMVNYFDYYYKPPSGEHPLNIVTGVTECPWNDSNKLMRIAVQGEYMDKDTLPPNNLVFLLDVSGSMNYGPKLPLLKEAFKLLVKELRAQDQVSIVVYAGAAGVVLPPTKGTDKETINQALDQLEAGGSTAGGEGIELAYKTAKDNQLPGGNNRVLLATDGDFNVGISDPEELEKFIAEKRKEGIYLSVLGFGAGNYNDHTAETLADKGNGNYFYIDNIDEAKKTLINEMGGTLYAIAKDVKLQLFFNPAEVKAYRLIGYENRLLRDEDFDNDTVDAGELGVGHTVTALYEIVPTEAHTEKEKAWRDQKGAPTDAICTVKLRYKQLDSDTSTLVQVPIVDKYTKWSETDTHFKFAAAVASYGMILRDSKHKGETSYDQVLRWAEAGKGSDFNGYRTGFIELVNRTKEIAK